MSNASTKKTKSTPAKPAKTEEPEQTHAVIDQLGGIVQKFDRFTWDVAGIALIAFSLVTLLALVGWTKGTLLSPWGEFLKKGLGLGSYPAVLLVGFLGYWLMRRRMEDPARLNLGQILALEGLVFVLMAFLAVFNGLSLQRADAGLDGGIVGWGLASLLSLALPVPWSTIVLLVLGVWFLLSGSGVIRLIVQAVESWLASPLPEAGFVQLPLPDAPDPAELARANKQAVAAEANGIPIPVVANRRDENLPPLTLLAQEEANSLDEDRILAIATKIEKTLDEFGVPSRVVGYRVGPAITQFAVEPGFIEKNGPDGNPTRQKVRVSQISNLSRDLTLALAAERLRIEAPVPGHSYVGVEVPNTSTAIVRLRAILESPEFHQLGSNLGMALGRDVSGEPVVADLTKMPHMLVAGTTGSGKSVCLASIITCFVMNNSPATLRLAILDPKMVELVRFNGLPHIMGKVETEIERMLAVLRWALAEMDSRYRLLETANARDLKSYNRKAEKRGQEPMPHVVIVIDELADLMMSAPDQTEHSLVRLAQMARAVGIHLIVATQRPSTDVVTGLIKANFPARIAFSVASAVDSRVILDSNGAESLLGRGDMLFLNPESGTPLRSQGVLLKDQEIDRVIGFWQRANLSREEEQAPWEEMIEEEDDGDSLVEDAIELVKKAQRASASLLQRRLRIGFPRAARLLDELEERGVVGPSQGGGKDREVLLDPDEEDEQD